MLHMKSNGGKRKHERNTMSLNRDLSLPIKGIGRHLQQLNKRARPQAGYSPEGATPA